MPFIKNASGLLLILVLTAAAIHAQPPNVKRNLLPPNQPPQKVDNQQPGQPPSNQSPGNRPPSNQPPGNRPPGNRPPSNKPPGNSPPGNPPPGQQESDQQIIATPKQIAWAKQNEAPVEFTNSLGMTFRIIPPGEFMMGA